MSNPDQLHRYLFENYAVRGELVTVSETYQQLLSNHDYPAPVQKLLGELLVATSLLTATLKFDGDITVQLQGDGPLKLAVINGNNRQEMRGVARVQAPVTEDSTLHQLIGNGVMVITISPTEGERYQGVVGLEGETLTECLEAYFRQSEQLPTRLFIHTDETAAAGMLLQALPAQEGNADDFDHLVQLTNTVKSAELFGLPANEVLYRLYHQEKVTLYEPQDVLFRCTCSRQRCADALLTLPTEEVAEMLEQDGNIDMHCDYCGNHYLFDPSDVTALYGGNSGKSSPLH
ncbi:Hsp33 family molecular chaperone HslO [Serratia symbiotica]|uniref:33 kDa chaperonin n=2 Tax=Serratia symbiotica TaxID=138074 RepID=E9CMX3_9GAMM|nr:Hsp33 family molecular chaperone HslO [Serratia symbiotica]EFW12026.1 putative heat shock protein Hsp33 [Serratia symbiotica str. Tucson]MBF1994909.1 Hsp33 family molecular chaperone HslO [Serratia symbiotica]MBQ0954980.1 Hsp33 family molecular chaperone HslO [Serratia symbiotica]NIH11051.1 Hsp33 family molecular chaperone HslO [Serratia symbiotica]QLH63983.1 Hsp33 family molecular chaperone HslO [Serratia symbiotica]